MTKRVHEHLHAHAHHHRETCVHTASPNPSRARSETETAENFQKKRNAPAIERYDSRLYPASHIGKL